MQFSRRLCGADRRAVYPLKAHPLSRGWRGQFGHHLRAGGRSQCLRACMHAVLSVTRGKSTFAGELRGAARPGDEELDPVSHVLHRDRNPDPALAVRASATRCACAYAHKWTLCIPPARIDQECLQLRRAVQSSGPSTPTAFQTAGPLSCRYACLRTCPSGRSMSKAFRTGAAYQRIHSHMSRNSNVQTHSRMHIWMRKHAGKWRCVLARCSDNQNTIVTQSALMNVLITKLRWSTFSQDGGRTFGLAEYAATF